MVPDFLSQLILVAVVALPLLIMGGSAWVAWRDTWRNAASDLRYTADAAAEYGLRVLSTHAVATGRVDDVLRGLSDDAIRAREADLHAELRRLVAELPQAEAAFVIDRHGVALVSANVHPLPRGLPVAADRDFFLALRAAEGPPVHVSQVYTGRFDGSLFFAVSRRRTRTGNADVSAGDFDGLVNLSVYPNRVAAGLRNLVGRDGDALGLIRSDGEVLARSTGQSAPMRLSADSYLVRAAAEGAPRALFETVSQVDGQVQLIALRRVEGWPVFATVSRPRAAIIAAWRDDVMRQLAVGVPATLALLGLVVLLRHGQRSLATANATLEARVAERTLRLAESEAEFRAIFESTVVGMAQADPRDLRFLRVNRRFCELVGRTEAELLGGMTIADVTHPEDRAADVVGYDAVLTAQGRYELEKRYLRPDGTVVWVAVHVALVRPQAGGPARTVAAVVDITERRRAEEQRVLLMREVDHRAKNALAVVQAALRLTPKTDPEVYARAVQGRVAALARAHTLLAKGRWEGAGLGDLAMAELAAFLPGEEVEGGMPDPARVILSGPELRLTPSAVQALSMALHELATNAVKYGALGAATGRLHLDWSVDPGAGLLRLVWEERGGPTIALPPAHRGFGSRVIEATVRDQLGGRAARRWEAAGLTCELEVPLSRAVAREGAAPAAAEQSPAPPLGFPPGVSH